MRDAAIIVDFDSQPNNVNHPPCLLSTLASSFLATDNISAAKVLLRQSFFMRNHMQFMTREKLP